MTSVLDVTRMLDRKAGVKRPCHGGVYQRVLATLLMHMDLDLDRQLRRLTVLRARELAVVRHRTPGAVARTAQVVLLRGGYLGRAPKTALPTRTSVAPSATASSRSPLMPMDSSVAV